MKLTLKIDSILGKIAKTLGLVKLVKYATLEHRLYLRNALQTMVKLVFYDLEGIQRASLIDNHSELLNTFVVNYSKFINQVASANDNTDLLDPFDCYAGMLILFDGDAVKEYLAQIAEVEYTVFD